MTRDEVRGHFKAILAKQGKAGAADDALALREVGFRSLDFAELALLVEMATGQALDFEAAVLRRIETVNDVLTFFVEATRAG